MQRLRSGTKITVWVLVISFGVLWVLADTQVFDSIMVGPQAMGEVNREAIEWEEFNQRLNMYTDQYREQTGESPDMEMRAQYERQAWEELVADKVMQQKMDQMGLTVTDSELMELVTGDNPAPFIREQFAGPDGQIDRQALQQAIQSPENAPIWMQVEQQLRQQKRQEKLNRLIESSIAVGDHEVEREFKRQNSTVNFDYVRFPLSEITEDDVEISDEELQAYYDNNRSSFKRSKTWNISFVEFSKAATEEDTLRITEELAQLRDEFTETDDHQSFVQSHQTETGMYDDFLRPDEVRLEHLQAYSLSVGEVSEPFIFGDKAHMIKLLETRSSDQTYTRIREIQLEYDEENQEEIQQLADELTQRARDGENFRSLAQNYSSDTERAGRHGEVGFISRDDRDDDISSEIFNASIGDIVGPVDAGNALYIYEVVDRSNEDIRFADLSRSVEADAMQTIERQARDADDFSIFAQDNGFELEAEHEGYEIQQAVATEDNPVISGLGQSHIVLNELQYLDEGDISEPVETDGSFYVIKVDDVDPEGYRSFEEVRDQVRDRVFERKRIEVLKERVASLRQEHGDDLAALAEAAGHTVESTEQITLGSNDLPGAGNEPSVIGAAFGVELNTLSRPIGGNNGVFIIRVHDRQEADLADLDEDQREQIRQQLQQTRMMAFGNVWMDRIKAGADVRDHRGLRREAQATGHNQAPGGL